MCRKQSALSSEIWPEILAEKRKAEGGGRRAENLHYAAPTFLSAGPGDFPAAINPEVKEPCRRPALRSLSVFICGQQPLTNVQPV